MSEHRPEDSEALSLEYQQVKQSSWKPCDLGDVERLRALGEYGAATLLFRQLQPHLVDPEVQAPNVFL